jgi:hypothetical protein
VGDLCLEGKRQRILPRSISEISADRGLSTCSMKVGSFPPSRAEIKGNGGGEGPVPPSGVQIEMEADEGGVVPLPGIDFVANENGLLSVSICREGGGPVPPPHVEIEGNRVEGRLSLLLASNAPLNGVKRRRMSRGLVLLQS